METIRTIIGFCGIAALCTIMMFLLVYVACALIGYTGRIDEKSAGGGHV